MFLTKCSQSPAPPHSLSSPSHGGTLCSRLLSLYRPTHSDAHDAPSRPSPFHWVRNRLSARPRGADIELHECSPAVVDVPHSQAQCVCHFISLKCSIPPHIIQTLISHHIEKHCSKRETLANHEKAYFEQLKPSQYHRHATIQRRSSSPVIFATP
jgi:hypothetical protein